MKTFKTRLIDIFDGVDDNSLISKRYLKFEVIFILTLLLLICSNQILDQFYKRLYDYLYIFFVFILSLQFFSRLFIFPYISEHSSKKAIQKIYKSILLDFFAGFIPLIIILIGDPSIYHLSLLSAVKIIRLFDVLPGFLFLKRAIESKREEILYSVLLVVFASFILSTLIYYLESNNPDSPFKSVLDTLVWSFSKYTNDYGSIADFAPYSPLAKFFATINGLLGVAVFAVPGALLSSAFIEQITQSKLDKEIEQKRMAITTLFGESYWELSDLSYKEIPTLENLNETFCVLDRFWTFESIQARLLYTDNEILQVARRNENLVFRILNDSNNNKSLRHKIIELTDFPEYFDSESKLLDSRLSAEKDKRLLNSTYQKRSYGFFFNKLNSNFLLISAHDGREACLSHFTSTLSKITNISYIAQTRSVRAPVTGNYMNFSECPLYFEDESIPYEFSEFKSDILSCISNNAHLKTVLIIRTADGKRGFDLDYTHGSSNGVKESFASGSIGNSEANLLFYEILSDRLSNSIIWNKTNKFNVQEFIVTRNHMTDLDSVSKLGNAIFLDFNAINCITLYINRDIIQGWGADSLGNSKYYAMIKAISLSINDFIFESKKRRALHQL